MRRPAKEMMDILLAQLVVDVRASGDDQLCAQALYPGEGAPLDYAECGGMLWVRLITAAPSTSFPSPNNSVDNCTATLAYQLEVGLMRPAPIPDEVLGDFELPDDEEHTAAAHRQMDDMELMYGAFAKVRRHIEMVLVGSYTPFGPAGGTVGGTWTLFVGNE